MSVLYAPETEYAKERVKWEAQTTEMGVGKRPYEYREYPCRLYKAGRPENGMGKHVIVEELEAAAEKDFENWRHSGFRKTPLEAIQYLDDLQTECATLAAELNFEQKNRLSENAAAEVEQARAEHSGPSRHMPSVPVTPIAPRKKE